MTLVKPTIVLVCLAFLAIFISVEASASNFKEAAFVPKQSQASENPDQQPKQITKVKDKKIFKVKPPEAAAAPVVLDPTTLGCILPMPRLKGWELNAQGFYARTRGTVRFGNTTYGGFVPGNQPDLDLNSDFGIPEHQWLGSFSAKYIFHPRWAVRYSIIPMRSEATASPSRTFNFGLTVNTFGLNTKVQWERLDQRVGLVFNSIRTPSTRLGLFGDYVRMNERIRVTQVGCCSSTFDNELNLAMAGLEFERCLKTSRLLSTLSLECKAGFAFGQDAIGSDLATGLRYSIPLNNGRWGFVKGGYRYLTYKKKYSDAKLIDTTMEGGFLEAGFIF